MRAANTLVAARAGISMWMPVGMASGPGVAPGAVGAAGVVGVVAGVVAGGGVTLVFVPGGVSWDETYSTSDAGTSIFPLAVSMITLSPCLVTLPTWRVPSRI